MINHLSRHLTFPIFCIKLCQSNSRANIFQPIFPANNPANMYVRLLTCS